MILARILRQEIIVLALGSTQNCAKFWYQDRLLGLGSFLASRFFEILRQVSFILANKIVLEYRNQMQDPGFRKHISKIEISPIRLIDIGIYSKKGSNKDYFLVGYIGRFSGEKGGELEDTLKEEARKFSLSENISFPGWIPHDELAKWTANIDLLVMPSYTEGLPGVLLEALASGTPLLATPVGAIPDIITDCWNGFLMETNSPECIASNILRVKSYPTISEVVDNGRSLIREHFNIDETRRISRRFLSLR